MDGRRFNTCHAYQDAPQFDKVKLQDSRNTEAVLELWIRPQSQRLPLAFFCQRLQDEFVMNANLIDYEKLGQFYLGRGYNSEAKQADGDLLLYDSKDLVTHGVVLGMTGSGKTGLCLALLEQAAMDNIPAIVIDPKGDISNLLLTFPDLDAASCDSSIRSLLLASIGKTRWIHRIPVSIHPPLARDLPSCLAMR